MATETGEAEDDKKDDKDKIPASVPLEDKNGDTGEGFSVDDPEGDDEEALRRLDDPEATRPSPSGAMWPLSVSPSTAKQFSFDEKKTVPGGNASADAAPAKPAPPPLPATTIAAKPGQRTFSITVPEPPVLKAMSDDELTALGKKCQLFVSDLQPFLAAVKQERAERKTAADHEATDIQTKIKSLEAQLQTAKERAKKLT